MVSFAVFLVACGGSTTATDPDGSAASGAGSGGGGASASGPGSGGAGPGGSGTGGSGPGGAGSGGAPDCGPGAQSNYDGVLTQLAIANPSCASGPLYALQDCGRFSCEPSPLFRLETLVDATWEPHEGAGCSCLPATPAIVEPGQSMDWVASVQFNEPGTYRWVLAVSWDEPECAPEPHNCWDHGWEELVTEPFEVP